MIMRKPAQSKFKVKHDDRKKGDIDALFLVAEIGEVPQIDLHGKDAYTAVYEAEAFIHESYMSGEEVVKLIHGSGAGVLRTAIRELVSGHNLVEDYRGASQPVSWGSRSWF